MDNKDNIPISDSTDRKVGRRIDPKKLIIPALMVILAILLVVSMVVFRGEEKTKEETIYGYFDTVTTVYSYAGDSKAEFEKNCLLAEETLEYYHKLFDIYNGYEGVAGLYEINRNAGVAPVSVSEDMIDFLEFCKAAYEITGGEVNVAMGAVLSLWHDAREAAADDPDNATLPDSGAISEAALHCDINNLIIDREGMTVFLSDPRMSLDVGAIGKGYAVERTAEVLIAEGVSGYVLDVGGNIRVIGEKPSGDGFKTGIKDPTGRSENGYAEIIEIKDTSAVTSGDYERAYTVGGKSYGHIIDRDSLAPPSFFASVTVITEDSGLADALSTALFCMELEKGLSLVSSLDGVEAVWVRSDGGVIKSNP